MPTTVLPKFKTPLEWSIDRRARVQKVLFELYSFLDEYPEFPRESDDQWKPIVRMVDIGFSLWRSAFLNQVKRERQGIFNHTKEFLQKILEQNTISFADDFRLCELTIGYYNSNARYRLERMYMFNEDLVQIPAVKRIYDLRKIDVEKLNQNDLWDDFYLALVACLDFFNKNWSKNVRPRRNTAPNSKRRKVTPKSTGVGSKRRPLQRARTQ
jgi:hypothetical protein